MGGGGERRERPLCQNHSFVPPPPSTSGFPHPKTSPNVDFLNFSPLLLRVQLVSSTLRKKRIPGSVTLRATLIIMTSSHGDDDDDANGVDDDADGVNNDDA